VGDVVTAFKPNDRVFIEARVLYVDPGSCRHVFVQPTGTSFVAWLKSDTVQLIPEPAHADPDLVPGMVVASKDKTDDRRWWVRDALNGGLLFAPDTAMPSGPRRDLPAEIRVIFDPRKDVS
jgi:hypothetical protein